jgi:predicted membrane-bound spermidine synthase
MAKNKTTEAPSRARFDVRQLYFISFIEGGVVMVTEIAGARILTPFFGASLYSWASTLSITLFALMTGYYFGGYATTKPRYSSADKIFWVFFLSGLTVLLMPSLGSFIMKKTISLSFFSGLLISELFFLFMPIFLMGMISPMIIFQITKKADQSGRSAGTIYAVSTCGGILFTLLFGFLVIPNFGITLPVRILGLSVSLLGLIFLLKEKRSVKKAAAGFFLTFIIALAAFSQTRPADFPTGPDTKVLEYSEGLLGELKVTDEITRAPDGSPVSVRKLKTNNIQQDYVFSDLPTQSLMYYVNFTKQLVKSLPGKESALIIGLGAGSLYEVLDHQGIRNIETVEIDKRIYDIGIKYFGMPDHQNHFITDGRYFLNVTNKKYDLIILDVIIGENVPGQLITLESFRKCYDILSNNGTMIIEHGGVNSFAGNSFIPSIVKTLNAAGFLVSIFNPLLSDKFGDILFVATKQKLDIGSISISDDVLIKGGPLSYYLLPISTFDNSNANILTDDRNNADILLKSHYFEVRKNIRKELAGLNRK